MRHKFVVQPIAQRPNRLEVAGEQVCLVPPDQFICEECCHLFVCRVEVLFAIAENSYAFVEIDPRVIFAINVHGAK